jgi:hypothetical protein
VIKEEAPKACDAPIGVTGTVDVVNEAERARNREKSKVRYRGLEKNANRLFATCRLANLYILSRGFQTASDSRAQATENPDIQETPKNKEITQLNKALR